MSHTPDADPTGQPLPDAPPPGSSAPPPTGNAFFSWLRGLGIVRGNDRWFAGVAGGIAARTGLDPMLVRGIFVVLALLGGPAILVYLIGWFLLPDVTGRIHVEDILRGRASAGVLTTAIILAALVCIPAAISFVVPHVALPFSGWGAWGFLGLPDWLGPTLSWISWIAILVFGGLWLRRVMLERGRSQRTQSSDAGVPAAPPADSAQPQPQPYPQPGATAESGASQHAAGEVPGAAGFTAQAQAFADRSEEFAQRVGEQAGAWGQRAGETAARWGEEVGKQADSWSARYAEHHDAHKLGAGHTVLTLALALLAAGGAAAWVFSIDPVLPFPSGVHPAVIASLVAALVVFAASLIVAGIRGRHTGWIGFLSFLGVIALLATVVLPWGSRFQAFGTMHVSAGSTPGAVLLAGTSELDLTALQPDDPDLVVWQLAGRSTIELPDHSPALVSVRMLAGQVSDTDPDGERAAGPFVNRTLAVNMPDGDSAAAVPRVTVYLLAGRVTLSGVERSSAESGPSDRFDRSEELERESEEDTRLSFDGNTTDFGARLAELEFEIARTDWLLENPDLTAENRDGLEHTRRALESQLERGRTLEGAR